MAPVDKRSNTTNPNASVNRSTLSISDCTTLVNDTQSSTVSPSMSIVSQASSVINPRHIRSSLSLLSFKDAAKDEHKKDKENSEVMKRFLADKDNTTRLVKPNKRNIKEHMGHNTDADDGLDNEDENYEELSLSPASPIGLVKQSSFMRHLDDGTWSVGIRKGKNQTRK